VSFREGPGATAWPLRPCLGRSTSCALRCRHAIDRPVNAADAHAAPGRGNSSGFGPRAHCSPSTDPPLTSNQAIASRGRVASGRLDGSGTTYDSLALAVPGVVRWRTDGRPWNFSALLLRLYLNDAVHRTVRCGWPRVANSDARGTDYIKPRCPLPLIQSKGAGGGYRLLFCRRPKKQQATLQSARLCLFLPLLRPSTRPAGTTAPRGVFLFWSTTDLASCRGASVWRR
jgi:hypothetical protein